MSRQAQDISEGIRRLESHTAQIMEESNARGIAVGVVDRTGRILYEKYFGLRDAARRDFPSTGIPYSEWHR